MYKKALKIIGVICITCIVLTSCKDASPTDSVNKIIDAAESKLFSAKSFDELQQMNLHLMDNINTCLEEKYGGYEFDENDKEFEKIKQRFDKYNNTYCEVESRFFPELSTDSVMRNSTIKLLAFMEFGTLTGHLPKGMRSYVDIDLEEDAFEPSALPTQEEINSVNSKLPVMVGEGTMFTKVEYNEKTKVETFFYEFTRDVDESLITQENINKLKANVINSLKNPRSARRLNAGVTYLYVYRSIDGKKLYELCINSDDLK